MKAMVIREFGGPDVFELADVPVPEVKAGHVLVNVHASSLNPLEVKIRSGVAAASAPPFPAILNGDFAGVVVAVGEGVAQWKTGDAVFGCAGGVGQMQGALAEYLLVDARLVARIPSGISFQTAALYPLALITAWEAILVPGFIHSGDKVLIHGASGGVGHLAAQLAKWQGAMVFGTVTSREKGIIAQQFGTDVVIVSSQQTMTQFIAQQTDHRGFDAVFDTVGGSHLIESFEAVRLGGTVCTISARTTLDLSLMHQKGLTLRVVYMLLPLLHGSGREKHGEILTQAAPLISSGQLKVRQADRAFAFSEISEAHRYYESHQAVGKVSLVNRF